MSQSAENAAVHGEAPIPNGVAVPIVTYEGDELVVCSLKLAKGLGIAHPVLIKTAKKYEVELSEFGRVVFQNRPFETPGGVQQMTVVYLNENQALFVGSLSRNTAQVVEFKVTLVREFDKARKALAGVSQSEILKEVRCLKRKMEKMELRHATELAALRAQLPPPGSPDSRPVNEMRQAVFACFNAHLAAHPHKTPEWLWERFWSSFGHAYNIGILSDRREVGENYIDVAKRYGYLTRVHEFATSFFLSSQA